ncbi:MAG: hypothetical protein V4665_01135 [Patescibacteria group bacterium]
MQQKFIKNQDFNKKLWYKTLLSGYQIHPEDIFCHSSYWKFPAEVYSNYFELDDTSQFFSNTIVEGLVDEDQDIDFLDISKQWKIKVNFFASIYHRFLTGNHPLNYDKFYQACRLYVLHEALHKFHNLDRRTVQGIGNFPKVVEEADYQADAFAIITDIVFYASESLNKDSRKLIDYSISSIHTALETTFSFNPLQGNLKLIQIRRVNRYLIWFYQLELLNKLYNRTFDFAQCLTEVLKILSEKPNIEISGPAIALNKDRDRIFYDLTKEDYHLQEIAYIKNNVIHRINLTGKNIYKLLIDGLKNSDFKLISEFMNHIFYSDKLIK